MKDERTKSDAGREYPWTLDPEEPFLTPADIPAPPWVHEGQIEEADRELNAIVSMRLMRWAGTVVPMTEDHIRMVFQLARLAACYGWCAAMRNGPMSQEKAGQAATEARKAKAEETRRRILAAYEQAAKSRGQVDVDELAAALGVGRSTVYRYLSPKQ